MQKWNGCKIHVQLLEELNLNPELLLSLNRGGTKYV